MNVAVIGAGTMGSGISQACAVAGHDVAMIDPQEAARERGRAAIESSLERLVRKEKVTREDADAALGRLRPAADMAALAGAEVVIEAVFEDLDVKRDVWRDLDAAAPAGALLATNTSSLSVTQIAAFTARPQDVCGLHFFNPVPVLPLVEVVRGLATAEGTVERARAFAEGLGKTPITCEDKPGFIVNRLLIPYINDAVHALAEGVASAEDIDAAMRLGANMPMGPLALADLVGLDVALAATEALHAEFGDPKFRAAPLLRQMVRAGRLGRKSGRGFHAYG